MLHYTHSDVATTNSNLHCNDNDTDNITRTIEGIISAGDVDNSYMYAVECCLLDNKVNCMASRVRYFFFQDYNVTNSSQCTIGSSNISVATVTVTTTVTECFSDLESTYISFPSHSIIPSPSLYISTVTTSKVTSLSSSHSFRFTSHSLPLSISSFFSTTSQSSTLTRSSSSLTRSSSSLTRYSSSLSDNISLTSSTEPTLTTQRLTSEYLAIIIVSICT